MLNLLFRVLLVIGSFLGGYVIGYNIIRKYNQYKCNKILNEMSKIIDLCYDTLIEEKNIYTKK